MSKKLVEMASLTNQVNKIEIKLSTSIEAKISDLYHDLNELKRDDSASIDKTLLRLLGTGGEWKFLLSRVDALEA